MNNFPPGYQFALPGSAYFRHWMYVVAQAAMTHTQRMNFHAAQRVFAWELFDVDDEDEAHRAWTALARSIHDIVNANGIDRFVLVLEPDPDVNTAVQARSGFFTRANLGRLDVDVLSGWFESMLHSDANLLIGGMMVRLEQIVVGNPQDNAGNGYVARKQRGAALLPKKWAGKGVSINPAERAEDDLNDTQRQRLTLNCGPRAILVALSADWDRCDLDMLLFGGEQLAHRMGLSGAMRVTQAENFVALAEYSHMRIVVWEIPFVKPYVACGQQWTWPLNQDRSEPDQNTICIFLNRGHYYAVTNQRAFRSMRIAKRSATAWQRCHVCFVDFRAGDLETHHCVDHRSWTCTICLQRFASEGSFNQHQSERNEHYAPCESCAKTVFNGPSCHSFHLEHNCTPATATGAPRATRLKCVACDANYRSDRPHDCEDINQPCPNCHRVFDRWADLTEHACEMQANKRSWKPVTKEDGPRAPTWRSHWAYDFETARGLERQPKVFVHQVLAWGIQLMLPDDDSIKYFANHRVEHRIRRLHHANLHNYPADHGIVIDRVPADADLDSPTIYVRGRGLQAFVSFVEDALCIEDEWQPTLWAHNGSRFDAKFLFDHYVNERGFQMAGCTFERTYGDTAHVPNDDPNNPKKWKKARYSDQRGEQLKITNVGNKLLKMEVVHKKLHFKCSYAHHSMPLRALPSTFGIKSPIKKGEFPYGRLCPDSWGTTHANGLPPLSEFDVKHLTCARRKEVSLWWIAEQKRRNVLFPDIVDECVRAGLRPEDFEAWNVQSYEPSGPVQPWDFDEEMWAYLRSDVHVLARVMEAYHRQAANMNRAIWETLDAEDPRRSKIVSPLDCSTAPGWAFAMFTTYFMPAGEIYTQNKSAHSFIVDSLRGGRTDKRGHAVEVTSARREAGDAIIMLDVVSLYPSVMKCSVHDTHFPTGRGYWLSTFNKNAKDQGHSWKQAVDKAGVNANNVLLGLMGENKTGFLQVDVSPIEYVTHPVLHHVTAPFGDDGSAQAPKLVFSLDPVAKKTYGWPELKYAIETGQVLVTRLHDGLIFDKGTTTFDGYIDTFFALKAKAKLEGNDGMYALAKLLLNSLWGKLGQRSYPVKEWVTDEVRLNYLQQQLEAGTIELVSFISFSPHRLHLEYRNPIDQNNLNTTAPHLAAFVSMWGRIVLHKKMLAPHGQRALYYDTDSAIIYVRAGDRESANEFVSEELGGLSDELPKMIKNAGYKARDFPDAYIKELVMLAPKTYAVRIVSEQPQMECFKVVCKGFQPSHHNRDAVSFKSFKELAWATYGLRDHVGSKRPLTDEEQQFNPNRKSLETRETLQFISNMSTNLVVPTERRINKSISGVYNKGRTNPRDSRLVSPHGPMDPPDDDTFLSFARPDHHYV